MNGYNAVNSLVLEDFSEEVFAGFYFTFGPVLLLCVVVLAIQLTCRRWLTSRQLCWLWAIVLLRLMLPVVPQSDFSLLNFFKADAPTGAIHGIDIQYQSADSDPVWEPLDPNQIVYSSPQSIAPPERSLPVIFDDVLNWTALGICRLWLIGAACVLCWAFVIQFKFGRRVHHSTLCKNERIISLLRECRRDLYVRQTIAIHIVKDLEHPALFGYWRPKILIPESAMELGEDQLRMVLLHELAHVRRRDILGNWLLLLVQCIHWWNPLFYIAAACYKRAREQDCDTMTIEQIGRQQVTSYGELLLQYASQPLGWGRVVLPASIIGIFPRLFRKQCLRSRLVALKQAGTSRHLLQPAAAMILLLILVLTGLTNAREPEPAEPKKQFTLSQIDFNTAPLPQQNAGPLIVLSYDVMEALEANRKGIDDQEQADKMFLITVKQLMGFASNEKPHRDEDSDSTEPEFICALNGTHLVVRATQAQHKELKRLLPLWKQGFNIQHTIECRIMTTAKDFSELVGGTWKPMTSPMGVEQPNILDHGDPTDVQVVAHSVVEQYLPMIATVVEEDKVSQFIRTIQGDARSNVMQSPKVTAFNGQKAQIFCGNQRPFVTSVTPDENGELKPDITIIEDGIGMHFRATTRADQKRIELDAQIQLSSIQDVSTFTIKWKGKDVTVQMPSIEKRKVETVVTIDSGSSFLVGFAPTKENHEFLYLLLTVRRVAAQDLIDGNRPVEKKPTE